MNILHLQPNGFIVIPLYSPHTYPHPSTPHLNEALRSAVSRPLTPFPSSITSLPTTTTEGPVQQVLEHPKSPDFIEATTSGFTYDSWLVSIISNIPMPSSLCHFQRVVSLTQLLSSPCPHSPLYGLPEGKFPSFYGFLYSYDKSFPLRFPLHIYHDVAFIPCPGVSLLLQFPEGESLLCCFLSMS
jgi:hypothetical protein